jgi:hypothetical protein
VGNNSFLTEITRLTKITKGSCKMWARRPGRADQALPRMLFDKEGDRQVAEYSEKLIWLQPVTNVVRIVGPKPGRAQYHS